MVDSIMSAVTQLTSEVVIILLGALATYAARKAAPVLDRMKKVKEIEIVDKITDDIVEFVEKEFSGELGEEKRRIAAEKVVEILASKNIHVLEAEVLAGIENGVRKLRGTK